jgi:hypothetical protein
VLVGIVIAYILGIIVTAAVFNWRAGLSIMTTPFSGHRITARYPDVRSLTGNISGGAGMKWWMVKIGKQLVWPIVFVVWLVKGRPEPGVQFNELALQRLNDRSIQSR